MTFSSNFLHAVAFLHVLHLDVLRRQIDFETEISLCLVIMMGHSYIHSTTILCDYRDGYGGLASHPYIREFQFSLSFSRTSTFRVGNMLKSNNNTQKAAIASPPSATHPQLWAELHTHVHVSIQECTLSHLHLHPQVHAHASTHTLHAATDA